MKGWWLAETLGQCLAIDTVQGAMHAIIAQQPGIKGIPIIPGCLLQRSLACKSMTRGFQHPCERRDVLLVMTKGYLPLRVRRTALLSAVHDRCDCDKGMQGDTPLPQ